MKQHPIYTVDYFIQKFEKIPEELWIMGALHSKEGDKHCAFGHCGDQGACSEEGDVLGELTLHRAAYINDNEDERYQQPTPKQRILAALYDIKAMLEPVAIIETFGKAHNRIGDAPKELTAPYVDEKLDVIPTPVTPLLNK